MVGDALYSPMSVSITDQAQHPGDVYICRRGHHIAVRRRLRELVGTANNMRGICQWFGPCSHREKVIIPDHSALWPPFVRGGGVI